MTTNSEEKLCNNIYKEILSYNSFHTLCSANISKEFSKIQALVISENLIKLLFSKKVPDEVIVYLILYVSDDIKKKYIKNMSPKYMRKFVKNALSFNFSKTIEFDTSSKDGLVYQLTENNLMDYDSVKKTIKNLSKKELCMMVEYMFTNLESDIEKLKKY
jgi:hypothetical protein